MTAGRGDLNITALVVVIGFYLVIFLIGTFATWKSKTWKTTNSEHLILAKRDIGIVVGIFSMTGDLVYFFIEIDITFPYMNASASSKRVRL